MTPIERVQEGTVTLDSRPATASTTTSTTASTTASTPELVTRLSQEVSQLVRDELRLAQLEVTGKAKRAGIGVGMVGAAGVLAWFGFGTLVATAVLALALVIDAWLAALIVAVVLLAAAGVVAVLGRNKVGEAAPPVPQEALASARLDVETAKEAAHR